jgi:hypothetical protein
MNHLRFVPSAAMAAALALFPGTVSRAQILNYSPLFPGLFPTGFNASGNSIGTVEATSTSEGIVDSHYSVVQVSNFVSGYTKYEGAAYVTNTAAGWHATVNGADWIEPPGGIYSAYAGNPEYWFPATVQTGAATNGSGVQYDYQIVFTVPSSFALSTISIAGSLAADDYVDIYLNGNSAHEVALTALNLYSAGGAFSLGTANGLVLGANTLTFAVFNLDAGSKTSSPSGLDVFAVGTGTYTVLSAPEIGAFIPVAGAVGLYGGLLVARRRARGKSAREPMI